MKNNPNGSHREIKIKGQRLEEVKTFKYLGAIITKEGSETEILSRTAQTTAAFSRLKIIWRDKNISLASTVKLMRTLIVSTFLYACASWTLQQKSRERSKPLRWDAIGVFWTFSTKTMWHTRRFATESRMQLECMMMGNGNSDGMATSQDPLAWRRQFCRGLWKKQEGEEDRRRDGKITSRNIRECGLDIPQGQRKTGKGKKVLLQCHLWCPRRPQRLREWDEMLLCNRRKVRAGDISHFGFLPPVRFRVSWFVDTTGLGCCIPPCFLVILATGWERTLICWYG